MNAKTTVKSLCKGINDSFNELLTSIQLEDKFTEPLKAQLIKMFKYLNSETQEAIFNQQKLKDELQDTMTKLEEKYIVDKVEEDV